MIKYLLNLARIGLVSIINNVPKTVDIKHYRGSTFVAKLRILDKDTREVKSLAGVTALMQLRSTALSQTILYTFSTVVDSETNTITISIPQNDWATIAWTKGVYDIRLTYVGGIVETVVKGTFNLVEGVSR